jgi:hypothetical protein
MRNRTSNEHLVSHAFDFFHDSSLEGFLTGRFPRLALHFLLPRENVEEKMLRQ